MNEPEETPAKFEPYPAYKDSGVEWLGEIPTTWEAKKTKYAARLRTGHTPSRQHNEYWQDCTIPWFGLADVWQIRDGRIEYVHETSEKISELGLANSAARLLPKGTVMLSRTASVGFSGIMGTDMATTQDFVNWICGLDLQPEYLLYVFRSMRQEFQRLTMGSTHQTIYMPEVGTLSTPVPTMHEQNSIVRFIRKKTDDIDGLLTRKEQLIKMLEERRSALITRAVTKGLDLNVRMRDSGVEWLGDIPASWKTKRLKYLVNESLKYGANESAELTDPDLPRYIRITDIREDGSLREDTFRSIPHEIARHYRLSEGDILFARSGATVGKTFRYNPSWGVASYAGYLIRARLNENQINSKFLFYFTQSASYRDWLTNNTIQATIQNVSADRYSRLSIPVPPSEEQEDIVHELDASIGEIMRLVHKVKAAINHLKELRTALISAAVTGKIDIRKEVA